MNSIDRVVALNDVSRARGGATGLALASVRAFRELGIPVTLIAGDSGDNSELAALGVDIVPLNGQLLLDAGAASSLVRGLYNKQTLGVIGEWIRKNDTPGTVYHLHTWSKTLSPSIFSALAPVRSRLLVSAHDFFLACPNGAFVFFDSGKPCSLRPLSVQCVLSSCDRRNYGHKLWRVARHAVQQHTLGNGPFPRVLAIHDAMLPSLELGGVPHESIEVLRNPVRAWCKERIEAERNCEFVFIGRLNEEKGSDLAARAARAAGVALRVIGDGPMSETLQAQYPEFVFEGRKTWEEISVIVRSARALVMSSRYPEPFGLVAGEALWSGLPVIVAETALISSEVAAWDAGLACDVRDTDALAGCMRQLMDDQTAERLSRNAFTRSASLGLTPDQWRDRLLSAYAKVIGAASSSAVHEGEAVTS